MRLINASVIILSSLFLIIPSEPASAADATATIVAVERWSCLFGGQNTTLQFRIVKQDGAPVVDGRFQWHYTANQRTLARGEAEIGRADRTQAEVMLRCSKVRDGVILKTELTVKYLPRGEDFEAATLTKSLWLFSEDPFVDQRETLKKRELSLFDPEGQTAELFKKIELPHQRVRNATILEGQNENSYVIVGEGTSLVRHRGLSERLLRFAAAGGTVLMLAPSEGVLPLPGQGGEPQPGEMRFRQHDVIREFDKRLDSKYLPGIADFAGSMVSLQTRLNRIGMEVSDDGNWPWFTIEYPETKGRFVFCGFSLIKYWDNGPTPRYLLNQILTPRLER